MTTRDTLPDVIARLNAGENNSTRKLQIELVLKPDGAHWIDVLLVKYGVTLPRFRPSFHDLHRIIQAIAACEDVKYPPPAKGRYRLIEFLRACVTNPNFDAIAGAQQIPQRDGDRIVKTNGAAVPTDQLTDAALDFEILERDARQRRNG